MRGTSHVGAFHLFLAYRYTDKSVMPLTSLPNRGECLTLSAEKVHLSRERRADRELSVCKFHKLLLWQPSIMQIHMRTPVPWGSQGRW